MSEPLQRDDLERMARSVRRREQAALDRTQAAEIQQLRLTVQVLMELLAEAGVLVPAAFDAKLEQRRQALEQKRAAEARRGSMTACTACHQEVPASRTQITENGTVCDPCYYNAT